MSREGDRSLAGTLAASLVWSIQEYLYLRPLEPIPKDRQAPLPQGVTFELINQANVGRIQAWRGSGEVRRFQRLLNRGDIGVLALANGEVIHHQWVALKLPSNRWVRAHDPIEVGSALIHRVCTRKDYRRQGVSTSAVRYILAFLHERYSRCGLQHVCALVLTSNLAAQQLFAGLGFCRAQQFRLVRLLGTWFIYWYQDVQPDQASRLGSPRKVRMRFKLPEILWDPRMSIVRAMFSQD